MAWGKSKPSAAPSTLSQLLPLFILLVALGGMAFVAYHIYLSITKIQEQATKNIGDKNIVFTKDGVRVGVKHVETEKYVDATQRVFVKAWELGGGGTASAGDKRRHSSKSK